MKSPAFQFYPDAWLSSQRVQLMTLEEEGAYIRLLSFCWRHGTIPADPAQAARLAGKGCSTTVATTVLAMFDLSDDPTKMIHERLEQEREKQRIWREKSVEGGKKSAELRNKSKGGSTTLPTKGQPASLGFGTNQTSTLLSPSLSLSSSPVCNPIEREAAPPRSRMIFPTLAQVLLQCAKIGLPDEEGRKFFDHYESNGWKVGGRAAMKSWTAALSKWKRNWEEGAFRFNRPEERGGFVAV